MNRKLNQILWGGDKPGRAAVLGIQHVFAMFGSTVLVPALTGLDPAVTLLCMGIGTLIFHLITRGIVPAFMGSSFSFISSICAVAAYCNDNSIDGFASYVGWGIIASGVLYLLLAGLVKLFGAKRITSFFPPIVTGCMIIIIGMMLAPTAMNNITTVVEGIPLWKNWLVAVVTILTIILVMFFTRGFIKLVPILIGIVVGYLLSLALGMVDTAKVAQASWFSLPKVSLPAFKNWDAVSFAITMIAPISIVTFVEHVGDITANGAVTGHNYIEEPGLHRTLLGCGLASIFSGAMGGPAATTYSENTGVLAATQNYNPATLRIAAVFAIVLSLFGKVSGILNSIPAAVMGGVSVILFGMIASVGLRMLVENHVDFTKSYNLVIAAVMLVIGLGLSSGIAIGNVTVSGTAIAAVLGVILAKVLPQEDRENTKAAKQ
ncbi:MAG: uracil-xanthine permease family protein [Faecousia sp.]